MIYFLMGRYFQYFEGATKFYNNCSIYFSENFLYRKNWCNSRLNNTSKLVLYVKKNKVYNVRFRD